MEYHGLQWNQLIDLAPELTLVIAAMVMALLDLFMPRSACRYRLGWVAIVAMLVSAAFLLMRIGSSEPVQLFNQAYRIDDFGNLLKLAFLLATILIVLMSLGSMKDTEPHVGEFYYLLLAALVGAMIMTSSADLITLYVGLELLSVTSYVLVGFRKRNGKSNEGAFKYIVLGGMSSATILYGMSFLYGMTGATNLGQIQAALIQNTEPFVPMIYLSFFLIAAGLGFKIAVAPFHAWVADVYQGASTPVTAFLAVVSKAAAFAMLFRIIYDVYYGISVSNKFPVDSDLFLVLAVMAAIGMIIGNVLALRQKNMKRMMAYSGVANAGYLLVPIALQFALVHYVNFPEFYFYLIAYLLMNIGSFAVLMMVERTTGSSEIRGFAGLYHRAPGTAVATTLLMLSLAGFPVTGGFFGKVFILLGAMETHKYWLGAILIGTSVMSFYYYFGIIKQLYMRSDSEAEGLSGTRGQYTVLWICAAASVVMGFIPQVLLQYIDKIFTLATDLFAS